MVDDDMKMTFKNKLTKKTLNLIHSPPPPPHPHHSQLYIKGTRFFKSFSPISEMISNSMARQIPASGGAQVRDKRSTLARSKEGETECTHHKPLIRLFFFLFITTTLYTD